MLWKRELEYCKLQEDSEQCRFHIKARVWFVQTEKDNPTLNELSTVSPHANQMLDLYNYSSSPIKDVEQKDSEAFYR